CANHEPATALARPACSACVSRLSLPGAVPRSRVARKSRFCWRWKKWQFRCRGVKSKNRQLAANAAAWPPPPGPANDADKLCREIRGESRAISHPVKHRCILLKCESTNERCFFPTLDGRLLVTLLSR